MTAARRGGLVRLAYDSSGPVWVYGHGLDPAEACDAANEAYDGCEVWPELAVGAETWARWQWAGAGDEETHNGRVCAESRPGRGAFAVTEVWRASELECRRADRHRQRVDRSRARASVRTWWPDAEVVSAWDSGARLTHPALAGDVQVGDRAGRVRVYVQRRDLEAYGRVAPPGAPIPWRRAP